MLDADVIGELLEIERLKYEVYITENICITVRIRTFPNLDPESEKRRVIRQTTAQLQCY